MHVYKFISGLIAFFVFSSLSYLFAGAGGFSLPDFNPVEALEGIAFLFAYGFGIPIWLSYIFSILILFGIPVLVYYLTLSLFKRITKQ